MIQRNRSSGGGRSRNALSIPGASIVQAIAANTNAAGHLIPRDAVVMTAPKAVPPAMQDSRADEHGNREIADIRHPGMRHRTVDATCANQPIS